MTRDSKYALHNPAMQCIFFIKVDRNGQLFMNKVNTNKRLELVKAIRMQNQYDRQLFRSRENFLYSDSPVLRPAVRNGELYSLEGDGKQAPDEKTAPVTGSFRIRLVIAMVLLLSFVICDIRQVSYEGENAETVFNRIVEDTDLSGVLHGMALPQAEF